MQVAPATPFTWSIHRRRTWLDLNTVTTTPGDDPPANAEAVLRHAYVQWLVAEQWAAARRAATAAGVRLAGDFPFTVAHGSADGRIAGRQQCRRSDRR